MIVDKSMSNPAIPYSVPYLDGEDEAAVAAVLRSGRLVMGPEVRAFETAIAQFTGRRHAVAVSSGTAALTLAMHALSVGPDWDVLVPGYTWVATYNVPQLLGARTWLVDVDPHTFCMSREDLLATLAATETATTNSATTARRKLVVPVHLFGYRAGGSWLAPLLRAHGAEVLGDGCCAFGGQHSGLRCGAWTPIECLSFHPRKVITTGEGGMILLDDDALYARLCRLRDHGAERSQEQRHQTSHGGALTPEFSEPGFNLRMTEMQGALGVAQMRHLPEILEGRRRVASRYDALLADGPSWLMPPPGADDEGRLLTCYVVSLWGQRHRPPTLDELPLLGIWRDRILTELAAAGIVARPPMVDLISQPYIKPQRDHDFAGTRVASRLAIGLPFHPRLPDSDIERVVKMLRELGEAARPSGLFHKGG